MFQNDSHTLTHTHSITDWKHSLLVINPFACLSLLPCWPVFLQREPSETNLAHRVCVGVGGGLPWSLVFKSQPWWESSLLTQVVLITRPF